MAKSNDGGQAFPQPVTVGPNDDLYPAHPGMTLRDYFAAQALNGLLSCNNIPTHWDARSYALQAYNLADEMLLERSK